MYGWLGESSKVEHGAATILKERIIARFGWGFEQSFHGS
jgi:hypothetical protein